MKTIWITELLFSSITFFTLTILILWRIFDKIWIPIVFGNLGFILLTQTKWSTRDHGGVNSIVLCMFLAMLYIIYFYIRMMMKYKKKVIWIFMVTSIAIAVVIIVMYFLRIRNSAEGWKKGLGEHYLNNDAEY